jgi:prostaglandin-E synthase 1
MPNLAANPAFVAYDIMLLVLCLNLLGLWTYSGSVRGKTKTTPNEEDAATILRGSKQVEGDPPEVARVLRAHANATANILPFVLLGLVFVVAGGGATVAAVLFGVFVVARLGHSLAYLGGKQPWRSVFFGLGGLATLILMGFVVRQLVSA